MPEPHNYYEFPQNIGVFTNQFIKIMRFSYITIIRLCNPTLSVYHKYLIIILKKSLKNHANQPFLSVKKAVPYVPLCISY